MIGEVAVALRLSREDKGKLLIQFGSFAEAISCEDRLVTLSSPNLGAVTPCANLVLTSEVTDGVANTAPVPQGTRGMPNRLAETETLRSASYLHNEAANKALQRASLSKSSSVKSAL